MNRWGIWLWMLVLAGLVAPAAWGRQADGAKAAIAIDVDVEALAGPAVLNLAGNVPGGPLNTDDLDVLRQTSRFQMFMSAPDSVESLAAMQGQGQPIPFEVYVRVDFKNADARQQLIDSMKPGIEEVEEGGAMVFKPTKIGPPNLRMRKTGEGTVEFGTVAFMENADQDFLTANLEEVWSAAPSHAFRLAADVAAANALVDELLAQAREEAPPPVRPFLNLIPKISTLRFSFDGHDATIVSLAIDGVDDAAGKELYEALEGLLGMAKLAASEGVMQLEQTAPTMAKVASAIVDSLSSKQEGRSVRLDIPRPEGLEQAIEEMTDSAKEAAGNVQGLNRLKQAALAVHYYYDANGKFPFASIPGDSHAQGKFSWRARVLPYIEASPLYDQIDWSQDFNAPANQKFANQMPKMLGTGSESESDIAWVEPESRPTKFSEILDGTSNTIMFVLSRKPSAWMNPANVTPQEVIEQVAAMGDGESLVVAMYDGSVHRLAARVPAAELKKLLDPADGEVIDWDAIDR